MPLASDAVRNGSGFTPIKTLQGKAVTQVNRNDVRGSFGMKKQTIAQYLRLSFRLSRFPGAIYGSGARRVDRAWLQVFAVRQSLLGQPLLDRLPARDRDSEVQVRSGPRSYVPGSISVSAR